MNMPQKTTFRVSSVVGAMLLLFGGTALLWKVPSSTTFASPKSNAKNQKITIEISGMHCGGCVESITRALQSIPGVHKAQVTLEPQRAVVSYDAQKASISQMIAAIQKAGYKATPPKGHPVALRKKPAAPKPPASAHTITLKIAGMSCGGCVARITEALQKTPGVLKAKVSLEPPQAIVSFQAKKTTPKKLAQVIRDAGYRVLP